jgi:hypothetical protein
MTNFWKRIIRYINLNERKTFKKYKERKAKIIEKGMLKEEKWVLKCMARWFLLKVGVADIFWVPAPQQQCCSQAQYV